MWGIVGVAIIATIILLTGKGSMLVTGFNTKNAEELTKYDVKKVSRLFLKVWMRSYLQKQLSDKLSALIPVLNQNLTLHETIALPDAVHIPDKMQNHQEFFFRNIDIS